MAKGGQGNKETPRFTERGRLRRGRSESATFDSRCSQVHPGYTGCRQL